MHRRLHQISGHGSRADRGGLLVLLPLLIAVVHTIALSTKPVLPDPGDVSGGGVARVACKCRKLRGGSVQVTDQ